MPNNSKEKVSEYSVDLICGGFPCQPVSEVGQRKGSEDERWLWPQMLQTIRLLRPRFVVVENVPGLLYSEMGTVLGDLAAERYDAVWRTLRARSFGLPHLRKRVFIVAHASEFGQFPLQKIAKAFSQAPGEPITKPQGWSIGYFRGISGRVWQAPVCSFAGMDYGIPGELDRLSGLGNAVVPQAAEWLGRILTGEYY